MTLGLPSGWKEVLLRDICDDVSYGYTASASDSPIGPKFLRITDIVPELINWDEVPYCEIEPKKLEKFKLKIGDIVIARTGATTGYAKRINRVVNSVFASYLVRIRVSEEHNDCFVGQVVQSDDYKRFIKANLGGAAQPNANAQVLTSYPIKLPPLKTQRKIAAILSTYDDLIENNTRRIKILEEMAQALYREWFVNFRFPGHEQVRMVDSSLGRVPEGWGVIPVTEAVEVNPRTKVLKEGEKPFVPMGCLSNDSMLITGVETRGGNSGSKFKNSDTLFARITPCLENGKTGYVQFLLGAETTAFGSTEFIVLRSRSLCPEYVYLMARSSEFRDNAIKSMSGATGRQRVSEKCFEQFFIAQPDAATLESFSKIAAQIFKQILVLANKSQNLRLTRDLLLPKLISGEIAVSDLDGEIDGDKTRIGRELCQKKT